VVEDAGRVCDRLSCVFFIVDGMNVIGSEPDGWWRDRAAARRRLVALLAPLPGAGAEVTVVFDGRARADEEDQARAAGVGISFAPGGPNAADDAIVAMVGGLSDPESTTVVTSDRGLVGRVLALGARVESAKAFRARLSGPPVPT
jgi:predicted RNA-binding protein with PIN domain